MSHLLFVRFRTWFASRDWEFGGFVLQQLMLGDGELKNTVLFLPISSLIPLTWKLPFWRTMPFRFPTPLSHVPRSHAVFVENSSSPQLEVDQIYHLACPASPPHYQYNPIKTIKTSTQGTLNMLGLAKRTGARMLLTSTSEVRRLTVSFVRDCDISTCMRDLSVRLSSSFFVLPEPCSPRPATTSPPGDAGMAESTVSRR